MLEYLPFGDDSRRLKAPLTLEHTRRSSRERGENYVIRDEGLVAAINASLVLGRPLLLTGEPGTGKTTLADRIAWFLDLAEPLIFETKSSSVARDLFYTYDALGRFQARHAEDDVLSPHQGGRPRAADGPEEVRASDGRNSRNMARVVDYLSFNALGRAILATRHPEEFPEIPSERFEKSRNRRVVVIDEVDKAHRDFPNDLLAELERMSFRISELNGLEVEAAPDLRPIVVITSNTEKNLPDAFLRRCVYYHIPFPEETGALVEILQRHLDPPLKDGFLETCVQFFLHLRKQSLRKVPSTAELVDWVKLLSSEARNGAPDSHGEVASIRELNRDQFQRAQSALVKFKEDQVPFDRAWKEFTGSKG